jgi:hypothetical protein
MCIFVRLVVNILWFSVQSHSGWIHWNDCWWGTRNPMHDPRSLNLWKCFINSFIKIFRPKFPQNISSTVSWKSSINSFINSFPKIFHQQFRENVWSIVSSKCLINSLLKMFDQ